MTLQDSKVPEKKIKNSQFNLIIRFLKKGKKYRIYTNIYLKSFQTARRHTFKNEKLIENLGTSR